MSLMKSLRKHRKQEDIRYILFVKFTQFAIILSFLLGLVNWFNQRPLSNILFGFGSASVCILVLLLSRNQVDYTKGRLLFFIYFTFIQVPIGYLTSPGSQSAVIYINILVFFMTSVMVVRKWEYIFPLIILLETPLLLRTELWLDDYYYLYTNMTYRINDLSLNIFIVMSAIFVTVVYMMKHYAIHNERLYKISITDSLTGLYNRRYFFEFAEMEYNRSNRQSSPFSVIFIDLNNFKRINDKLGHPEGDKVLKNIADLLMDNIRSYDIAARYGGDEFIVILPDTTQIEAKSQMERLEEIFKVYSEQYEVLGFSVGLGYASSKGKTLEEVITIADQRLYAHKEQTKKEGRNVLL